MLSSFGGPSNICHGQPSTLGVSQAGALVYNPGSSGAQLSPDERRDDQHVGGPTLDGLLVLGGLLFHEEGVICALPILGDLFQVCLLRWTG